MNIEFLPETAAANYLDYVEMIICPADLEKQTPSGRLFRDALHYSKHRASYGKLGIAAREAFINLQAACVAAFEETKNENF